ncbi:hypothetical protein [Streptomyces sp. CAU 1734]|uniref:hypothetical protein n=1 Tax=Streptomyces sp. CAU 1734 TaxID=3140360 RepID=UPI00326108ED
MGRSAALRLDEEWSRVRSGRACVSPGARERMLRDLISALTPLAENDLPLAARLGLRYADLARHHFDTGRRAEALIAVREAVRRCAGPAGHDAEHARWYAKTLTSQALYLAEPLSDELGLPRWAFQPIGDRPPPAARADGLAALAVTRRAMSVWEGLDQADPRNRAGLAQSRAHLGDRFEELGEPVEAVIWAVRAEREFQELWSRSRSRGGPAAGSLEHLDEQLRRRLRRCPFAGGLTRLRAGDLVPERLLPLAVVAARIEGVEPDGIAEGLRLTGAEVRRMLRACSWRAVWRFDTRDGEGAPWTPMAHPWRGMDAVTDRSAAAFAAELTEAFLNGPGRPGGSPHWRVAVWWEDEEHLDGSRFRLSHTPAPAVPVPSRPAGNPPGAPAAARDTDRTP